MGWTFKEAKHYKNGKIDRKAECDELMSCEALRVEKSAMVGCVYYAAVRNVSRYEADGTAVPLPEDKQSVFGVVSLTSVKNDSAYNFGYKDMSEDMHPYFYKCPKSIIKLLSPTDNENALAWREKCLETASSKCNSKQLRKMPIGTIIELADGTKLIKRSPAYQFKKPFWYCESTNKYVPKRFIGKYIVIA